MDLDIGDDEADLLCGLLDHDRLSVEVSRLAPGRAALVPGMIARGLLVESLCGPSGRTGEPRPLSVSISTAVAEAADVVAWRDGEDGPLRWRPRADAAESRRRRVYTETDLTARQARRGDRAEGLANQADPKSPDPAAEDLDDSPDDGRMRRPTRLIGVSSVWYPPTSGACPTCGSRIEARGYPNTGEYCIRCDALAGHARPRAFKKGRAG